jgi:hypothetical protein
MTTITNEKKENTGWRRRAITYRMDGNSSIGSSPPFCLPIPKADAAALLMPPGMLSPKLFFFIAALFLQACKCGSRC